MGIEQILVSWNIEPYGVPIFTNEFISSNFIDEHHRLDSENINACRHQVIAVRERLA